MDNLIYYFQVIKVLQLLKEITEFQIGSIISLKPFLRYHSCGKGYIYMYLHLWHTCRITAEYLDDATLLSMKTFTLSLAVGRSSI